MADYTYKGNKDPNNTSIGIRYEDQGEIREEGGPKLILPGEKISLDQSERDRLSQYFVLENKSGNEVNPDAEPPVEVPAPIPTDGGSATSTSVSEGTLSGSESGSSSGSKSTKS